MGIIKKAVEGQQKTNVVAVTALVISVFALICVVGVITHGD